MAKKVLYDDVSGMVSGALSFYFLPTGMVLCQIAVVLLSTRVSLFPGEELLRSIVSTFSQIVSGLYGITLAGYTFFLSRIDGLRASDVTLDYIIDSIKRRFRRLIWYITFNVLMLLSLAMILMYCPLPEGKNLGFLYRLGCNEFVLFAGFSVGMILYYSVKVVDSNAISTEATKLKYRISSRFAPAGSAVEFIGLYDGIVEACRGCLPENVLTQLTGSKGNHFELILELLPDAVPGFAPLVPVLTRIHQYYECAVNCRELSVSEEMCVLARKALAALQSSNLPARPGK